MPVAVVVDIPGGAEPQHEQIIATVFSEGRLPDGWLVRITGPTETGWRIVNVVPSHEEFEAFSREQLRRPPTRRSAQHNPARFLGPIRHRQLSSISPALVR
jgi:hypothetical protein